MNKSERWPNTWSKVKTLEDKPRSGWPFFHKLCEKYYRKSCKYLRNNSTKQKGKKISTSHYRSKFRVQKYGDKLPKKVGQLWREKGSAHFMQAWCQRDLPNFLPKENRPANSCDVNPQETIWIIVDETTYKDPAPKHWTRLDSDYVSRGRMWL